MRNTIRFIVHARYEMDAFNALYFFYGSYRYRKSSTRNCTTMFGYQTTVNTKNSSAKVWTIVISRPEVRSARDFWF